MKNLNSLVGFTFVLILTFVVNNPVASAYEGYDMGYEDPMGEPVAVIEVEGSEPAMEEPSSEPTSVDPITGLPDGAISNMDDGDEPAEPAEPEGPGLDDPEETAQQANLLAVDLDERIDERKADASFYAQQAQILHENMNMLVAGLIQARNEQTIPLVRNKLEFMANIAIRNTRPYVDDRVREVGREVVKAEEADNYADVDRHAKRARAKLVLAYNKANAFIQQLRNSGIYPPQDFDRLFKEWGLEKVELDPPA